MIINEAVRALRRETGETQQAFATRLGMSISSLQNYEQKRRPGPKQLIALARAAKSAGRDDLAKLFFDAARLGLGIATIEFKVLTEAEAHNAPTKRLRDNA